MSSLVASGQRLRRRPARAGTGVTNATKPRPTFGAAGGVTPTGSGAEAFPAGRRREASPFPGDGSARPRTPRKA